MSFAEYDLYKVSGGVDKENEGKYRAKLVSKGTVSTEELIERIVSQTGFSRGDATGMIESITDNMLKYLEDGYNVQFGDLGYFSISLTSRVVEDKKEIHAQSVFFNRLIFKMGSAARKRLKWMMVQRVRESKGRSSEITRPQKKAILKEYLKTHPFINRTEYEKRTHALKGKAIDDLNAFIAEGWLQKYGSGRTVVYYLKKENG